MSERADDKRLSGIYSKLAGLGVGFSPSAPINKQDLFAGRTNQLQDVIMAINMRGQHVVLFGERGVGKTSLASIVAEVVAKTDMKRVEPGTINCDAQDDFSSLWKKIFREMSFSVTSGRLGFSEEQNKNKVNLLNVLQSSMQSDSVTPDDIRFVLSRIGTSTIIIDEIDRIQDEAAAVLMADTLKTLSDHSVPTTLILVGVADSVEQLIKEHRSIERALTQIHMPRMSPEELYEIVYKGAEVVGMQVEAKARERIAWLSRGLPHYTHLLGYHSCARAIWQERDIVKLEDVNASLEPAVEKAQQSIRSSYYSAISSHRKDNLFTEVLLACALADSDDLGYFAASDVRKPLSRIMGRLYDIPAFSRHLNDFCLPARGEILQKVGTARRYRFRFVNPLLQPFVVINGLAKGLIPNDLAKEFSTEVAIR